MQEKIDKKLLGRYQTRTYMKISIKNEIKKIEFAIEVLVFYFMYSLFDIEKVMGVNFGRYIFIFSTIYVLVRDRIHNNLIWQDSKNVLVFYLVLFIISMVVKPMKELSIDRVLHNLLFMIASFVLVILIKKLLHTLFFNQIANSVLIVGIGHHAQLIADTCKNNRYSLMNVKGFLSLNNSSFKTKQEEVVEGEIIEYKDVEKFIEDNDIDVVVVAIPQLSKPDITKINQDLSGKVKTIKFMPQINSMYSYNTRIEDYDGLLLICNRGSVDEFYVAYIKRFFDILAGIVGLIVLIPVTLIIKLCNLFSGDRAPVIFKQERIGLDGKTITIYKYRSMIPNAEAVLEELMKKDKNIRKEYLTNKKLENDPRITKVGKFIREKSIDELPQLINVLKGEMTLVGPRPYLFREKEDMGTYYDSIVQTKPGITGMWQVSGRSDVSFDRRCRLDEYYSKNQSFWLDFTVIIKTIKTVFTKRGAK